jgi:hypothetical protein
MMNSNMEKGPSWIAEVKETGAFAKIPFESIFMQRKDFRSISLLFTYNSYRIYEDASFSINGGPRLKTSVHFNHPEFVCIQRHTRVMLVSGGGGPTGEEISFLMGFTGGDDEERRVEVYIHISPDGKEFKWTKER